MKTGHENFLGGIIIVSIAILLSLLVEAGRRSAYLAKQDDVQIPESQRFVLVESFPFDPMSSHGVKAKVYKDLKTDVMYLFVMGARGGGIFTRLWDK